MDELVQRWGRWLQNTGYDGGINSPAMLVLQRMKDDANRIERQEAEIRSLRKQVKQERAGIADWLEHCMYESGLADDVRNQKDKEPT